MSVEIIDVHHSSNGPLATDIQSEVLQGLSKPTGQKEMPTILLYDERGLRLYDDITTEAPEYYLFSAEEEILKVNADDIVQTMHRGGAASDEIIVELGAGALRKTSHLLRGLSRSVPDDASPCGITYYALDLERRELERTLGEISSSEVGRELSGKVKTKGIWGTYNDGLKYIESGGMFARDLTTSLTSARQRMTSADSDSPPPSPISSGSGSRSRSSRSSSPSDFSSFPSTPDDTHPQLHFMFLGSSLGNFSRADAPSFLRSLPLRRGSGDTLLIGLDHDNEKALIEEAYNDPKGHTKRFIFNGLTAAGRALGNEKIFDETKWEYVNTYDMAKRHHKAFFKSKCSQSIVDPGSRQTITFEKDELMKIEESLKFSEEDAFSLFAEADLRPVHRWMDQKSRYSLWLLERPPFCFPLLSSPSNSNPHSSTPYGTPSLSEWRDLWTSWDFITTKMIPQSMMFQRPIDLRHICLFYLGHIPTFLDIHLSRALQTPNTEPANFKYIFERGIDPDVDDPSQCHAHSEVPIADDEWPSQSSIIEFQNKVRQRLSTLYDDIVRGTLPLTRKLARMLFITLEHEAMHAETLLYMLLQRAGTGTIPPSGFAPPSWETLSAAWNTTPKPASSTVTMGPSSITLGHDDDEASDDTAAGDVKDHQFGWDNESPKREVHVEQFKIEWRPVTNGEFYKFYTGAGKGKVALPASWVQDDDGIRVRTLYGPVSLEIAQEWPVIAPYDALSTYATVKGGRLPTEAELVLFYDKYRAGYEGGANVGFRNWHPVPATTGGSRNGGKGCNGGVWEWTSTVFDKVEGFVPSTLYPGYSMDFFDGKHNVVLGGSHATIPRIASRRSFRNWYQRNYPYAWAGARIIYDIPQN